MIGFEGLKSRCNVGGQDRAERIFHGVVFLLIAIFLVQGIWQIVLGIYGGVRLLTGIFAFCPIYIPIRHSTYRRIKIAGKKNKD